MAKKKKKTPAYRLRYLEKEPVISFHVPAKIKKSLVEQSEQSGISLSGLLLKFFTNESSAKEVRERIVKDLINEGKELGRIEGFFECKSLHEEIQDCGCKSCTLNKFARSNLLHKAKGLKGSPPE